MIAGPRSDDGALALPERWERADPRVRGVLAGRVAELCRALGAPTPADEPGAILEALGVVLDGAGDAVLWLALTVLSGAFPDPASVRRLIRAAALDGPVAALEHACLAAVVDGLGSVHEGGGAPAVRVVTGAVVAIVDDTSRSLFATGIQRVARECVRRWCADHEVLLVAWDIALPALRELAPAERACALHGADTPPVRPPAELVVVPWRSTVLLPELTAEARRVTAFHALVRFSGNRSGAIAFDTVPLTTAETTQSDVLNDGFAANLAALAHVDRIAPISAGAGVEYAGWRGMLAGTGDPGPDIAVVGLPTVAQPVDPTTLARVRDSYAIADLPLVLVVGSHEPRKNHGAVLHAAELLWREGRLFSLAFLGGNSWSGEAFAAELRALAAAGRPVHSVLAAPDDDLWAAYRVASFTVFPSLNEGFGLPLAESLAAGTPVVTSGFGSMREIGAAGGVLYVDPRDPHDIARAMRRLLTDGALLGSLAAAARRRPVRTWDEYAAELWSTLVEAP